MPSGKGLCISLCCQQQTRWEVLPKVSGGGRWSLCGPDANVYYCSFLVGWQLSPQANTWATFQYILSSQNLSPVQEVTNLKQILNTWFLVIDMGLLIQKNDEKEKDEIREAYSPFSLGHGLGREEVYIILWSPTGNNQALPASRKQ